MVVDQTKDGNYQYLKKVGNNWKYDVKKVNPKLIARLYKRFDTFDLNSDKAMTLKEVLYWPDRMRQLVNSNDKEIESMKAAVKTFFSSMGVNDEGGLKREDWVEANQVLAQAEFEREKRGEQTMVALLGNAYFDVLDDNDDRCVGLDELKTMMKAFDVPQEAADTFFEKADVNKDGRLERKEMHKVFSKFWLEEYNPEYDGIYAYKY